MSPYRLSFIASLALLLSACAAGPFSGSNDSASGTGPGSAPQASQTDPDTGAPVIMATDPGYRLSLGDEISISVHGEPDISTAQRVDKRGIVRIPYIDEVSLANKTVREAEGFIEQVLVERKLLKDPLVSITVRDYALREISISGTGLNPGVWPMPRETSSIEIVELINRLGGFSPTAKSEAVKVIRLNDQGEDFTTVVDVEAMMKGKKGALKSFLIYPGDRIHVDQRLF